MIFNQVRFFCMMLLLTGVKAQEETSHAVVFTAEEAAEYGVIITEMSDEEIMAAVAEGSDDSHFLRGRELQNVGTCRATSGPYSQTVCGMLGAPPEDTSCLNSQATCAGMKYPCSCSGSSETSCSYCTVRMPGATVCQVTGSSSTFSDSESLMTTCRCTYVGNGQVRQDCFHPSPAPIPVPTFWPVNNPSPVNRSPVSNAAQTPGSNYYTTNSPIYQSYYRPPSTPVSYTYSRPAPTRAPVPAPTRAPVPAPVRPVQAVAAGQPGKDNKGNKKM
jgi:hypothetical protein